MFLWGIFNLHFSNLTCVLTPSLLLIETEMLAADSSPPPPPLAVVTQPPAPPKLGSFLKPVAIVGSRSTGKTRLARHWIALEREACAENDTPLLVIAVNSSESNSAEYHEIADIVIESWTCAFNGKPAYKFIAEWQRTRVARNGGAARAPCLLILENIGDLKEFSRSESKMLEELLGAGIDIVAVSQTNGLKTDAQDATHGVWSRVVLCDEAHRRAYRSWPPLSATARAASGMTGPCGCASCAPPASLAPGSSRHLYIDSAPDEAAHLNELLRFAVKSRAPPPLLTAAAVRERVLAQQ